MDTTSHIYSFDIFDTLLSRDVANPQSIWILVGIELQEKGGAELPVDLKIDFKTIRSLAEKICTNKTEGHEATLDGIYNEIAGIYPEIPGSRIERIKQIEIELELKHIYGIAENIATALKLIKSGERVVLASDMYLPAETIRKMLYRAEPRLAELKIYLSSERKAGKHSGALFDIICKEEEVTYSQIQHCGDNEYADYLKPKSLGLSTELYSASQAAAYEACYSDKSFGLLPNVVAGISKRLRLTQRKPSKHYELGACFTAPFFYGFIHALVSQKGLDGPEAFYFLARDGHVLRKMAHRICQVLGLKRELKYLYVSRESVYLASIYKIHSVNLTRIIESYDHALTASKLAGFLRIKTELLEALLPHGTLVDQVLDACEIDALKSRILNSTKVCDAINQAALKARKELIGYLRCEGVFEHNHFALVDTGWRASTQDAIYGVMMEEKPDIRISGFYYGSSEISEQTVLKNSKYAYLVKPAKRQKIVKVIELLTVADHGRTVGYEESSKGAYRPCFEKEDNFLNEGEKADYFQGIEDFTTQLTTFLKKYPNLDTDFMAVDNCLFQELARGSKFVAECFGDFTFASGAYDEARIPMAPKFTVIDAMKYVFSRSRHRIRMTHWIEGTKARSSLLPRAILVLDIRALFTDVGRQIMTGDEVRQMVRKCRRKLWRRP